MDLRKEFKDRCADLAVGDMAHFKPQKILDRVNREFASQYPSGAVFPTSKQVSILFDYLNDSNISIVKIFEHHKHMLTSNCSRIPGKGRSTECQEGEVWW